MPELLIKPEDQLNAFREAARWSTEMEFSLAWLAIGDGQGPSWRDLAPYLNKVRRAVVGLGGHKTDPVLLRELYRQSVLRLVPTTDESFLVNLFIFHHDGQQRCLLGSAPFSTTQFHQSFEHWVLHEGTRDTAFCARSISLLERCAQVASVPTLDQLEAYERERNVVVQASTRVPLIETIAGNLCRDTDIPNLVQIGPNDPSGTNALSLVADAIQRAATRSYPGARLDPTEPECDLYWIRPLELWAAWSQEPRRTGWHVRFGVEAPTSGPPESTAFELDLKDEAFFARDSETNRVFLVHPEVSLAERYRFGVLVESSEGAPRRDILVGEVGSPDFLKNLAAFTRAAADVGRTAKQRKDGGQTVHGVEPPPNVGLSISSSDDEPDPPEGERTMLCPYVRQLCNSPDLLNKLLGSESWDEVSREERRAAAEMSFAWFEAVLAIQAAIQPGQTVNVEDCFEAEDVWNGDDAYAVYAPTELKYSRPGKGDLHFDLCIMFKAVNTILGLRTCLTVYVSNSDLPVAVRKEWLPELAAKVEAGTWNADGVVFSPPREFVVADARAGLLNIAICDLTTWDSDSLDSFVEKCEETFRFGFEQAGKVDARLTKFVV